MSRWLKSSGYRSWAIYGAGLCCIFGLAILGVYGYAYQQAAESIGTWQTFIEYIRTSQFDNARDMISNSPYRNMRVSEYVRISGSRVLYYDRDITDALLISKVSYRHTCEAVLYHEPGKVILDGMYVIVEKDKIVLIKMP